MAMQVGAAHVVNKRPVVNTGGAPSGLPLQAADLWPCSPAVCGLDDRAH